MTKFRNVKRSFKIFKEGSALHCHWPGLFSILEHSVLISTELYATQHLLKPLSKSVPGSVYINHLRLSSHSCNFETRLIYASQLDNVTLVTSLNKQDSED